MKSSPFILIVDDIEYNVILLNQILLNAGYKVLSASSGKKCLEILKTDIPDMILLDVIMPEMNGFDIIERINLDERTKNIPIIFLSAISDYETKLKGLDKGAVDYITKPYDDREVIARVKVHLKIKELENENLKYIQELELINRDKDNLLKIIAHDMRSPLTSIMLLSEFLMSFKTEIDIEKIQKYSNIIFNSSKKILKLINQLLQTKKIGQSENEITSFDLVKTIGHSTDLVIQMLKQKSIHLEFKFCEAEIIVNLDEGKFDQILNNIIYNAIKFTRLNGLIQISVDTILEKESKVLHISIQDNGIGIPAQIKEDIFSDHPNRHRVGTDGEEGTGLGLSITKNLVQNMNGKIEIESEEQIGTNVHLYFYNY